MTGDLLTGDSKSFIMCSTPSEKKKLKLCSTMEQKRLLTIGNAPLCTLFFRCATQRMSVMLQNDDVKSVSIFWSFMQEIMNEWPWELFPAQPLTNSQTAATGTNNRLMSCILSCWMDDHTNILWANVPYSNVSLQVTKLTCWSVAAHHREHRLNVSVSAGVTLCLVMLSLIPLLVLSLPAVVNPKQTPKPSSQPFLIFPFF